MNAPSIALIGCGRWGRHILRDLKTLGCRVSVVASSADSVANARNGGADAIVERLDVLLPAAFDGVVIATPTITHAAVLETVLPWQVPVFCEKPLTADAASAARIAAAAGERVFCMDKWRYHPAVQRLKALVDEGSLGRIRSIRSLRTQWQQPHDDVSATWILLPHDFSMAMHLLGELPPLSWARPLGTPGLNQGLIVQLGEEPQCVFEISAQRTGYIRFFDVLFEGGAAGFSGDNHQQLELRRTGSATTEYLPLPDVMPLYAELEAFVGHLRGGPPPLSPARQAAQVVLRVEEALQAAGVPRWL